LGGTTIDLKDLQYFITVYEQNGFLRAGALLNTVQSNVSSRIRKLEEHLGTTLFIRLHRGVKPTTTGEILYPRAKQLIALAQEIEQRARARVRETA